jgi:predicted TPR repeat methyltransferase
MEKRAIAQEIFIKKFENIRHQRIIDVGCGYGFLAERMRTAGADVTGLEFDPDCVRYCNTRWGLNVGLMNEEKEIVPEENVDLVILSHVLEHLPDIDSFLGKIKLKTKGIFIEVPKYSVDIKEQFVDQEGHVNFFTEKSILNVLKKLDYCIIRIASFGPSMDYFWKSKWKLINYLHRLANRDFFFDDYQRENPNGIWIRIMASTE